MGKIFARIIAVFMPLVHIPATHVDIILDDNDFPLDQFGIAGKVISTPGHSFGSVSILLDTGEAFVGDLAMNAFPLRLTPGLPIFAEDMQKVKNSWDLLLDKGASKIYPAHGTAACPILVAASVSRLQAGAGNIFIPTPAASPDKGQASTHRHLQPAPGVAGQGAGGIRKGATNGQPLPGFRVWEFA
ncbi:MAG: hypothetical protein ACQETR_11410 [Thermodesulfobacteriota bacterium]